METNRFDAIAKTFAGRRSRRSTLKSGAASLSAAALSGVIARAASAQDATPAAGVGELADDNSTLFVQTASAGSFQPNPDAGTPVDGTPTAGRRGDYLLTLTGHPGKTIAFSDRPQRDFGQVDTAKFFTSMGFTPADPPNAAIVADSADQAGDVLVVELLNPAYDAGSQTLTYEAKILADYAGTGLAPVASKQRDQTLAASFTAPSLFIDDCPNANPLNCYSNCSTIVGNLGDQAMCWNGEFGCQPCHFVGYGGGWAGANVDCDDTFASCGGNCFADYRNRCPFGP